ncbi:hypothetical protein H0H92_009249 [Tricholoma furcatifolium]|nr:hypothetical protein H0H92_009249 [Tricholoma furcatifolium]
MGVLGLTPFLQKTCPEVIKRLPDRLRELAGKRVVIDGTLITQRLHFAPSPHPYRHIQGWYKLARDLREAGVSVVCVFDGQQRHIAKAREHERRKEMQRKVMARGALEIDRSKRLKQLSDILPHFWELDDTTRKHAAGTLRTLVPASEFEEQERVDTAAPSPTTEDVMDGIVTERWPPSHTPRLSVEVCPLPEYVQDETLWDEGHLVVDYSEATFFDHDLEDSARHIPLDHPWFQEFIGHLPHESHPDIFTSVGLRHIDEIHPPHETVELHLLEEPISSTSTDRASLPSASEELPSTLPPEEPSLSPNFEEPSLPSSFEEPSLPFISEEVPLSSPSEQSPFLLTPEEPSLSLGLEEPSLPSISEEMPLPPASEQPSPPTSEEQSLSIDLEEPFFPSISEEMPFPSTSEQPPLPPTSEEQPLSFALEEPPLPSVSEELSDEEVPSTSTVKSIPSPEGIERELSNLYLDYRQSVSRFAKLSDPLTSPPLIPSVGDADTQAEIMMTKAQYHLTLEEGQFWDEISAEAKKDRLPNTLEKLFQKSDMMSSSFERRMNPPTQTTYNQSREILRAMGVPCLETTGAFEAEALASSIVLNGLADYVVSEDTDVLVYEAPLVRNLTNKNEPLTLISGAEIRTALQLDRASFVDFALLLGTDFSQRIRRVGPARALKFIREHGSIERVLELETKYLPPLSPEAYLNQVKIARLVFCTLPPLPEVSLLEQREPDDDEVIKLLQRFGMGRMMIDDSMEWDHSSALTGNYFQDNPSAS